MDHEVLNLLSAKDHKAALAAAARAERSGTIAFILCLAGSALLAVAATFAVAWAMGAPL
jgi:hypothetical protein